MRGRKIIIEVLIMDNVRMCTYHIKHSNLTLVTDWDIRGCTECMCELCCTPMKYCECR